LCFLLNLFSHAGGNDEIKAHIEGLSVVGGRNDDVKGCNRAVSDGDSVRISENLSALSLWTPCHTRGHTCYFIQNPENENDSHVFTGDTLFIAGCGKFFEGSASEMEVALVQKLGKLPDETKVWCGHEYTLKNLEFAASIETENKNILEKLEWAKNQRECMKDTVPSSILEEKLTNPFMRVHIESVQNAVSSHDPIHTMELLRELKNNF